MPNPTVLVDAFDYPASLPPAGVGTDFPFDGESIATSNGGDILDANVQMCYRTREYEIEPILVITGAAHSNTGSGGDTTSRDWSWEAVVNYNPTLIAYLNDATLAASENDFISYVDRATNGRKGWMYKGRVDESPPPLIGSIDWVFHELVTIGGVPQTPTIDSSTEGIRLDSFEVIWADGDSGAGTAPVMAGSTFQGAFLALFNISIGVPLGFASAWANTPSGIQGGRPTAYTNDSEIRMVMTRKMLVVPNQWTSTIAPNTDVVFDVNIQQADFAITPTVEFPWT